MRSFIARTVVSLLMCLLALSSAEAGVEAVEGGILFTYYDPNAGNVSVAGAFNGWNTTANPMTKDSDGTWSVVISLGPGKHEYKFVVDNQWVADPENPVTAGEYGNSVVHVGPQGDLVAMAATANTPYSAKILLGGRVISRFISRENADRGDRFEMDRPYMDFDLDWTVRANDYLDLHMLTSINNENEETVTDFWKTNLRFDRGSVRLHTGNLQLKMFDNESAGRFDDPLELVGGIGIYNHDFGFRQQGAVGEANLLGFHFTVLYSDDFENGGTTVPTLDSTSVAESGTVFDSSAGVYRFERDGVPTYNVSDDDNDKDVFAARATYPVQSVRFGASYRRDRGYNPGSLSIVEIDPADTTSTTGVQTKYGKTWERWWGAGGDVLVGGGDKPYSIRAEALHGRAEIFGTEGRATDIALQTTAEYDQVFQETVYTSAIVSTSDERLVQGEDFEIDRSTRYFLGADYRFDGLGLDVGAGWERETHEQTYYATALWDTLDNKVDVLRFHAEKKLTLLLGRPWTLGLGLERYDFNYDKRTPWRNQFWFDERNFWLEQSEHEITVERLLLVGGRNASIVRPVVSTMIWPARSLEFTYRGTFAGIDLDKDPKYTESLFQLKAYPWQKIRLYSDTRLVKYNDPLLDLFSSYWSTFAEVAYEVSERIEVSLSFGVDPFVVDETTNEFDYIGRDLFLFDRGANGDVARRDWASLAGYIPDAEQALEDERRIQVEGIVRF